MAVVFIILLSSCLLSLYLFVTRNFDYWKARGIKYVKPFPFIGNLWPVLSSKTNAGGFLSDIYQHHKDEPYVGIFLAYSPGLVIRDYELIKRIFTKDFHYFQSRSLSTSKDVDSISSSSLFFLNGLSWKNTGSKLSPLFTNKKQKYSFNGMMNVMKRFDEELQKNKTIDVMDLSFRLSVDVISESVFRSEGGALLKTEKNIFKQIGDMFSFKNNIVGVRMNLTFFIPEILHLLGLTVYPKAILEAVRNVITETLESTKDAEITGDYIHSLLELKSKGPWEGSDGKMIYLDDDTFTGVMFMFITAGMETTSSAIGFCLYELAKNPKIQEILRCEIKSAITKNDDQLDYESLKDFSDLTKFIHECLRKHPPFPLLDRKCTKDYKIPGTEIVIEKGTKVFFPMIALQNDEKYYENPDEIRLERFDQTSSEADGPYFPFGLGHRSCIGNRFALQAIRTTLITVLRKYRLSIIDESKKISFDPRTYNHIPKEPIMINIDFVSKI